jgi:DNA-binding beta-propeller fold protein YncE
LHPAQHVPVGNQPRQVTAGGGRLWVSVFGDDSVAEVDPHTKRVLAHIKACGGPQGLAYADGQLWVGCTNDGVLVDIDAQTRKVVRRVTYEAADAVTNTGTTLRVTSDQGPSTAMLDARSGRLTGNVKLSDAFIGDANADVVAAGGSVWVSSPDEGAVYKLP